MSKLYWRITRDTLNVGEDLSHSRVGTEGPYGCDDTLPTPLRFRLVSDDWPHEREAYYGVAANDDSIEYALDGFGTPDAGMTAAHIWMKPGECKYLECKDNSKGHWEPFIG